MAVTERAPTTERVPTLSALLLTASTALFAVGALWEHRTGSGGEQAEHAAGEAGEAGEQSFTALLESPAAIVAAIIVGLLLALAVWRRPTILSLLAAAVFSIGAAVFDALEVAHQLHDGHTALTAIAALVTITRLGAAGTALAALAKRC
jgi:hypothetical protein